MADPTHPANESSSADQPGQHPLEQAHGPVSAETPSTLTGLKLRHRKDKAAGLPGVLRALQVIFKQAGVKKAAKGLAVLNQKGGIDCMSCAWPEPDGDRSFAEFCENGAKALAHEMDARRCTPDFFAQHSVSELSLQSDYWLEQQGRLTHPMVLPPGATHYQPVEWDEAYQLIAQQLLKLSSPDEASFYTSGRASNEAAFIYQLMVRQFGTNNLPDCSNMCHESSGAALTHTIGIGKGTVTLEDFQHAELIIIMGQNPGTNHPRMLTTLQEAKRAGAKIIAVNPLPEAGLLGFMDPQRPLGLLGKSTPLADLFLQVKINGDLALLKGIIKEMLAEEDRQPGRVFDLNFIANKTQGVESLLQNVRSVEWEKIVADCGIDRAQIRAAAELVMARQRIIICWAMGLTQQNNAVETIQEVVNLLLLRGSIGKRGAGVCPVRGHSNVQGDRTMGVWEKLSPKFRKVLAENFAFDPPTHDGLDAVETIRAMHAGKVKVFLQLGGNFLSAGPDTLYLQEAMSKLQLSARIGTKLNRSDLVAGRMAMILPCLGRSEIDRQQSGEQFVTTENSMGVVEMSRGRFEPASPELRSETAILCGLAEILLTGRSKVPWRDWSGNYDLIRDAIAASIPGCKDYNEKVREPGGFYLPNSPRDNEYPTDTGVARFTVNAMPQRGMEPQQLVLMTIRSHDQFNTTIYGLHDRYRGVHNERRVVFMNSQDMADRNVQPKGLVDIVSHYQGQKRHADRFIAIAYDIPRGCCAVYYPEGNVLVPLGSVSEQSNQPASKYVLVTISPADGQR